MSLKYDAIPKLSDKVLLSYFENLQSIVSQPVLVDKPFSQNRQNGQTQEAICERSWINVKSGWRCAAFIR